MHEALRITVVNAAYDASVTAIDDLLDRYDTLTAWCAAMAQAGAELHVVQRFSRDGHRRRGGTPFTVVADRGPATPSPGARLSRTVTAAAATDPHVVHVNGLGFPALVGALGAAVAPRAAIVVQDHAGIAVPSGPGPLGAWRRARFARGLSAADAVSFCAEAQARPWRDAGILVRQRVLALVESSTTVVPTPRADARARTGLTGTPLILWVGRLVPNKDPLTVLSAFERVVERHGRARLAMIFERGTLTAAVRRCVEASPWLCDSVSLVGPVPHAVIGDYYGAADVFVSGSRSEGSGYALIEAMACGLVPVVTDIPSFAAIAGECGARWRPGDAAGCAEALLALCGRDLAPAGAAARERFARHLSWPALADRTLAAYRELAALRPRREAGG